MDEVVHQIPTDKIMMEIVRWDDSLIFLSLIFVL